MEHANNANIPKDGLLAANEMAAHRNISMGEVISDLARKSLRSGTPAKNGMRKGFPVLAPSGQAVTSKLIKAPMDAED
jgi:hypothetical protein